MKVMLGEREGNESVGESKRNFPRKQVNPDCHMGIERGE